MRRLVRSLAPVACAIALVALASDGCGGKSVASGGGADATAGTITIGVIDSLTGQLSGLGIGLNQAIGVAAQQINRVGVAGGQQVTFDVRDDTSDPTQSAIVAQALIAEGVVGILGPISSGEVQEVEQYTYAAKVPEISASATSTELNETAPVYFFRTAPPDDLQARAVVMYLQAGVSGQGDAGIVLEGGTDEGGSDAASPPVGSSCQRAFIVNGDDAYGTSLGQYIAADFPGETASVVGKLQIPTEPQADYSTQVKAVVDAHPDCLILIVYSAVGAEFMRELEANGFTGIAFGTDGEYDADFIPDGSSDPGNPASPNSTANFSGTAPDTAPDTPEYNTFREIWHESYPGQEPPPYGANQYDAAVILALAIEKSWKDGISIRDAIPAVAGTAAADGGMISPGPPDAAVPTVYGPGQIVEALDAISRGEEVDYNGASGDCNFEPDGDVKTGYIVWKVEEQQDQTYAFETIARIGADNL